MAPRLGPYFCKVGRGPLALSPGPALQREAAASLRVEAPLDWTRWSKAPIPGPSPRGPDSIVGLQNVHGNEQPGCLCVPVRGRPACQSELR